MTNNTKIEKARYRNIELIEDGLLILLSLEIEYLFLTDYGNDQ